MLVNELQDATGSKHANDDAKCRMCELCGTQATFNALFVSA